MRPALDRRNSTTDILEAATEMLRHAGIDSARLDAEVMLAEACGVSRAEIHSRGAAFSVEAVAQFRAMVSRRAAREPLAYIIGHKEFFSLDFEVTPAVLIPRPETETLVEAALEFLATRGAASVLDIGTGSGAIAVAIAVNAPYVRVIATDISDAALQAARRNVRRHRCGDRIDFVQTDLFPSATPKFDLIVSNPPYIPSASIAALDPEIARHEPRGALNGGPDGLAFYRGIAARARQHLVDDGAVIVEAGAGQASEVAGLFRRAQFGKIDTVRDLAGIDRVVSAQAG
jgi:release factor glutamine methyltransferase